MTIRRIGILGGTFDPIHNGHVDVADAAVRALGLTRMFVITANIPPHRPPPFASAFQRFAMVTLAVLDRPGWRASDLELRSLAPSYTSTTLQRFHERGFAPGELFFVIGADAFADIATWRDYPQILSAANFAVVSRPGCPTSQLADRLPLLAKRMVRPPLDTGTPTAPLIVLMDAPTADVSSTVIRQRCAAGESIAGMVAVAVQHHIEQHGLYASRIPGGRALDASDQEAVGKLHGQD
jgi:nicotinate-nucleotide adenylyltransferase